VSTAGACESLDRYLRTNWPDAIRGLEELMGRRIDFGVDD
jgi:hypothetical protein